MPTTTMTRERRQRMTKARLIDEIEMLERHIGARSGDVNALDQTEKALRESERRYQAITANVPGVVYQRVLRPDGAIDFPYVSPGLRETHGLDPKAVMRDPDRWLDATHPEDRARLAASNAASIANLSDWSLEYRIITPGGAVKWVHGISHVRRADDGGVVWDGILFDVTEDHRIRQRMADLAKFPEENPNAILRTTLGGRVRYANDAARAVRGLLVGRKRNRLTRKLAGYLDGITRSATRREVDLDNGERIISFVMAPVAGEDYVNWYGRDVTNERRADQRNVDLAKFPAENPSPVFRVTPDGSMLDANVATRAIEGLLVGRKRNRLSRKIAKFLPGVARRRKPRNELFFSGGRVFALALTPVHGAPYINVYGRDVTEEHNTRLALEAANEASAAAEARLQAIIGNSPATVCLKDAKGRYQLVNKHFTELHGTTASAVLGKTAHELFPKEIADPFRAHDLRVLRSGVAEEREQIVTTPAGPRIFNEIKFPITANGDQHTVNAVGLIATDVTERKKAEGALRESEARLLNILNSSPVGVTVTRAGGATEFANPRAAAMFGVTPEDFLKLNAGELYANLADREKVVAALEQKGSIHDLEVELRRADGESIWVMFSSDIVHYDGDRAYLTWLYDITERRRAAGELAAKEAQLRIVLDNMPGGIRFVDKDRNYVFFNARYSELYDFPKGLLRVGESNRVENLHQAERGDFGPGDPKALTDAWLKALPVQAEPQSWVRQTATGKTLQVSTAPTPDGGIVNIVTDISESKRVEQALRESEERYALVVAGTKDGLWDWNFAAGVIYLSPLSRALLGFDSGKQTVTPEEWQARIHPDDLDAVVQRSADHRSGASSSYSNEYRALSADGVYRWVLDRGTCLRDESDQAYRMAGSLGDITDRKQGELFLRSVVDSIPAALNIRDTNGRYILTNKRLAEYYGDEPIDWIGKTTEENIPGFTANDLEEVQYRQVLETGEPIVDGELKYQGPDGADEYWLISRQPIYDDSGQLQYVLSMSTEITDRKRAEEELHRARILADQANRAKSEFLAVMSHEIRTPMNGIIGMIELLGQTRLSSDQQQMSETIRDSAFALLRIIDDILDLSKIEAGKLALENLPVSLIDVVEGVADTLSPNAHIKGIGVATFVDPAIPADVLGDPVRLRQILFNLGGNAIKFTESGKVVMRADLVPSREKRKVHIRFRVIDTGIGINEAARAKLFRPFSQAESTTTRRFGGTGLGLSICRRLTDMMGGECGVDSVPGEGSTFWVELALDLADDPATITRATFDLSGLRILVAMPDDEERGFFADYLATAGASVEPFARAPEALASARQAVADGAEFDVAVVAEDCGAMNAVAFMAALREPHGSSGTKGIVVYRQGGERQRKRNESGGFAGFVAAPVRRDALLRTVAAAVGLASPEVEHIDEYLGLTEAVAGRAPSVADALAEGRLILLAEDHPTNQQVLLRQLNVLGYAAEVVPHGKQALAAMADRDFALLLTDCHMPEMDGFDLTRSIRETEDEAQDGRRLPIVAVTANVLQGEADRCLAAGMDDFLGKPVVLAEMKRVLQKWMPATAGGPETDSPEPGSPPDVTVKPAQEMPADSNALVDLSVLGGLFGDDPEVIRDMLVEFVATGRKAHHGLIRAIDERSATDVAKIGHNIKGSSRIAGVKELSVLGGMLELAGVNRDWTEIERLARKLDELFVEVGDFVDGLGAAATDE